MTEPAFNRIRLIDYFLKISQLRSVVALATRLSARRRGLNRARFFSIIGQHRDLGPHLHQVPESLCRTLTLGLFNW